MAIKGVGASFKLDNASNVLTEIATHLDTIDGSSEPEELDGTTFQPGVAAPTKNIIAGTRERGFELSGKWTAAAEDFFSGIEGSNDLDYEYSPEGTAAGKKKIFGLCNCLSYSGPQSSVDGITTFSVSLRATTRTVTTH